MGTPSSSSNLSEQQIADRISTGDRVILGQAITLVESRNPDHEKKANKLLSHLLQTRPKGTLRIGVSGAPGVGKSTFIEAFGLHLLSLGKKVAVLSVDPSSDIHKGSILGDKTRMEKLSVHPNAFIRPTAAGNFRGGIAWRTREAIILCEAAGYNLIFIETIGVGQSEYKVNDMVDCFLLLLLPGGGDELQGIKKGIVEMADILVVNKCDGDRINLAQRTQKDYSRALHLAVQKDNGWLPKVLTASSIMNEGISEIWDLVSAFQSFITSSGHLNANRKNQNSYWFQERISHGIRQYLSKKSKDSFLLSIQKKLMANELNPIDASELALEYILKK